MKNTIVRLSLSVVAGALLGCLLDFFKWNLRGIGLLGWQMVPLRDCMIGMSGDAIVIWAVLLVLVSALIALLHRTRPLPLLAYLLNPGLFGALVFLLLVNHRTPMCMWSPFSIFYLVVPCGISFAILAPAGLRNDGKRNGEPLPRGDA